MRYISRMSMKCHDIPSGKACREIHYINLSNHYPYMGGYATTRSSPTTPITIFVSSMQKVIKNESRYS